MPGLPSRFPMIAHILVGLVSVSSPDRTELGLPVSLSFNFAVDRTNMAFPVRSSAKMGVNRTVLGFLVRSMENHAIEPQNLGKA